MKDFRVSAIAALALPLVFACGGDNLTLPSEGAPANIVISAGGELQSGKVSTELAPLTFLVTDTQGRPVPGATVSFVLTEDRGGGSVTPATDETNGQGQVSTQITLGTEVGSLTGEAQVQVPEGSTPVSVQFTATALSDNANQISIVSGDPQSAPVGAQLPDPLVVKVTDNFGNPIAGVTITWEAVGGGSLSETSTVTLENGQTSVTRTLGPTAGEQQTTASAEGLSGSPVTFTHTATAGNASSVTIASGNNQEAPAGSKLPQPLVVKVLDQDGNPIPNLAVSWVVGDGGGSADPATSNTGQDGLASTEWTLGPAPANNTLNAVVSGVGTATFRAKGTGTGAPAVLAVTTQPPSSVTSGAILSPGPVVQVQDGAGHDLAVAGVDVTVSISSGKGQLSGTTTVATDANGQAHFNDLRISGATGSHKLIFAADGLRSATSSKIEVEKTSTTTAITSVSPEPSELNQPVTVAFTVSSPAGTPTGDVEVSASGAQGCTVPVSQGSCQITFTASGDQTITATYKGDGTFASSSATQPHHVNEPLPPPNTAPVATPDSYATPVGQPLTIDAPGVLANDSDPEGDALSAQVQTPPAQGGFVLMSSDGSFTYFPGLATGQDSFTYSVSDGKTSSTATVTITLQ